MIYIVSSKKYGDIQAYINKTKALQDIREWNQINKENKMKDTYYIREIEENDIKFLELLNGNEIIGKVRGVYDKRKGEKEWNTII